MRRYCIAIAVALLVSSLAKAASFTQAEQKPGATNAANEESVRKFLRTKADDKETRYIAVFRDLNGDGTPEVIAYLVGNDWCGSGGCNLFILQKHADSWKIVTSMTITHPPVRVLNDTSNGWHTLSVWVGGGGIREGYEAELRFNGKTYPRNPSVPPARRAGKGVAGEEIINSFAVGKPLF
jgi:hypothetical protein